MHTNTKKYDTDINDEGVKMPKMGGGIVTSQLKRNLDLVSNSHIVVSYPQ